MPSACATTISGVGAAIIAAVVRSALPGISLSP
jgi:hypothetical protein